jgi:hypothetical protein
MKTTKLSRPKHHEIKYQFDEQGEVELDFSNLQTLIYLQTFIFYFFQFFWIFEFLAYTMQL